MAERERQIIVHLQIIHKENHFVDETDKKPSVKSEEKSD